MKYWIGIIIIFAALNLQAQKTKFEFKNKEVVITYPDSTIKAHILIKKN